MLLHFFDLSGMTGKLYEKEIIAFGREERVDML